MEARCSVFNCASQAASAVYVRCKHCTRVFCQSCVHHSSSARRCYKRPRGHSFVLFAHSSSQANSSSNNNNNTITHSAAVSQESQRHRRHHHGYHHHHHQSGSRHQHNSSSRRHHHHQHPSHHHDNQEFSQHQHQRRDYRRSRSRGQHRSGGQEFDEGHVRVQREGHHSRVMERFFEDLII